MKHNGNDPSRYIDGASEYEFDNISRICCRTKLVFKKQNCLCSTTKFQKDLKGKTIEIKSYCSLKQIPTAFSSPRIF